MALVKCRDCDNMVSTSATACPKCGAPMRKPVWPIVAVVAALAVGAAGGALLNGTGNEPPGAPEAASATPAQGPGEAALPVAAEPAAGAVAASAAPVEPAAAETLPRTPWEYSEKPDGMSDRPVKGAAIRSRNTIQFGFPYQGEQRAMLMLRLHPRWGRDAYLSIERGQFLCRTDDCTLRVRFDDGPAQAFSATEPADNSSNLLFFSNYSRFVGALKKSKTVAIEAQFYQEGARVFTFDTAGLVWDDVPAARPVAAPSASKTMSAKVQSVCGERADAESKAECERAVAACMEDGAGEASMNRCIAAIE